MNNKKVLAVIPARKGSKGLPGKNIMLLNGKPLISYMIEAAVKSVLIDKLIVSTNDERIADIALKYGADVPFLRPDELAQDETPIAPVLKHAMEFFDARGWKADIVATLQPTNPLTTTEIIDSVIQKHLQSDCDSVATVSEMSKHPYRAKRLEKDGRLINFINGVDGERYLYRQQMPTVYSYNGAIYSRKRKLLENWTGEYLGLGSDIRGVIVKDLYAMDINNFTDFRFAGLLLAERNYGI